MKPASEPPDEMFRLEALRSLCLLDTAPDEDFDNVVQLGRTLFDVPICLVSLVDSDRQWFKASAGLAAAETPRNISFCGYAILAHGSFVVLDAAADERFHDNPLVTGYPHVRFYAGAPIWLPTGYPIGTLCIISPDPRERFDRDDQRKLEMLSKMVLNAITVRALRAELDRKRAESDLYWAILQTSATPVALVDADGCIERSNSAFAALCQVDDPDGLTVGAALPAAAPLWNAGAMGQTPAAEFAMHLPGPAAQLLVRRRGGSFVITGTPGR